ncbi:phage tail assembly protein [Shinella fusca]|uniref:Phage tail assembly protein n=1 Tax=Shinella fusca TaxID=544480 RepID=A0A7W7YQW0_9HYPH|nr:phage tail assembly protein [Shinella fusca]MBB5040693.1 hypothetical protein [Shinella fusca]
MTTIILSKPIANGPELISVLTLRPPRLGDSPILMRAYAAWSSGDVGSLADNLLDVLAAVTSLPRAVVDQIDPVNLDAVLDGLTRFIRDYSKR